MARLVFGVQCAAIAFVAGAAMASPALAQSSPPQRTELTLCNKTGANIQIAVAYIHAQSNRWMLSAWHTRKPGECKSFATVKSGLFYYHAKNERGAVWPNAANTERNYCVPNTAVNRDMSSQCGVGETNRPFRGRVMDPGKYTFSFS